MATLNFKGKTFVQNHHLLVKYHQLIGKKDKSVTKKVSLSDNLIIHGDNLKALKALLPMYGGKIKCIYIDPPYNTGNEKWVYNDTGILRRGRQLQITSAVVKAVVVDMVHHPVWRRRHNLIVHIYDFILFSTNRIEGVRTP
jgi:hypothetical protein